MTDKSIMAKSGHMIFFENCGECVSGWKGSSTSYHISACGSIAVQQVFSFLSKILIKFKKFNKSYAAHVSWGTH
jgi:hypothetical protein